MTAGYLLQRDSGARAARNLDFCRLWLIFCNLERGRLILGLRVWKGIVLRLIQDPRIADSSSINAVSFSLSDFQVAKLFASTGGYKRLFPIPEMQSVFHLHARRNAVHHHGVHPQSRSSPFTIERRDPAQAPSGIMEIVGDNFPDAFQIGLKSYMRLSEPLLD